jgi:SAP domain
MVEMIVNRGLKKVPKPSDKHQAYVSCLEADDRIRNAKKAYDHIGDDDLVLLCKAHDLDSFGDRQNLISRLLAKVKSFAESSSPSKRKKEGTGDDDDLDGKTVAKLKDLCKQANLAVSGNKATLVKRLRSGQKS